MKKRRISTTISSKHYDLLEKYTKRFETQQKALEHALENLENNGNNKVQSEEDRIKLKLLEFKPICFLHKDIVFELFRTADSDRLGKLLVDMRVAEYQMLLCYQKHLKDMSLKEVVEGIVVTSRVGNWLESIEYIDGGNFFTIMAIHNAKDTNFSKIFEIFFQNLFETYGVKTESKVNENSLIMKIFNDNM